MNDCKFIPVETVINIYNENVFWLQIPGFNGYEISNTGVIRSMKHFKKYPYGILLKPVSSNNVDIYELSNNNNERVKMTINDLWSLAINNPYKNSSGYPRQTICTDVQSRNLREFVHKETQKFDTTPHYVKFTIIDTNL